MDYNKYAGFVDYSCQQIEMKIKELEKELFAANGSLTDADGEAHEREEIRRVNRESAQTELNAFSKETCKVFNTKYDFINKIMDLENYFKNIDNEY